MARPAALVLTPRFPWPLDDGGRIVLWQSLWSTARSHDVTLISFVPPGAAQDPIPAPVRDLAARIVRVPHRPPGPLAAAVGGLVGSWPYTLIRYQSESFARAVREAVEIHKPRYAVANHLHMAPYAAALGRVPMVLRAHNAEHRWMERYVRSGAPIPARLYACVQVARIRRAERSLCERAQLVLAIQDEEAAALRALAPRARVGTVPVGIDLSKVLSPVPVSPPVVLMPGSFAWPPNVAGAVRFLRAWPIVRESVPDARLRIAGKSPPAALRAAARRAGAEVAADVASMYEELARASAVVVPLWVGAGARVKIVEAMAARVPVVATPIAAEGLGLRSGEDYLSGESEFELADSLAQLLQTPGLGAALARSGRSLAEARWSLEAAAALEERLIDDAIGGAR